MRSRFASAVGAALLTATAFAGDPNMLVDVSRDFVSAAAARQVNQERAVCEVRGGVPVRGTSWTCGAVSAALQPCAERAELCLVFEGVITTRTVATRGSIYLHNAGRVPFRVVKPVAIDAAGVGWAPAWGCADADLDLLGVTTRLRGLIDPLARRLGRRGYYRQEDEQRREVERDAVERLTRQFDSESDPRLAEADRSYRERVVAGGQRDGRARGDLRLATTLDVLTVRSRVTGPAPDDWAAAPGLVGRSDLALRAHQSVYSNRAAARLAGRTVTDVGTGSDLGLLLRSPEEWQADPDAREPFSLTFADTLPIEATFAEDKVRLRLRTRGFTSGDRVIDDPYDVHITYDLTQTPDGLALVRSELRTRDPMGRPLAGRPFTIARLLTRRFDQRLKRTIKLDGLELRGDLKKVGRLAATQASSSGGWLTLAWQRTPGP